MSNESCLEADGVTYRSGVYKILMDRMTRKTNRLDESDEFPNVRVQNLVHRNVHLACARLVRISKICYHTVRSFKKIMGNNNVRMSAKHCISSDVRFYSIYELMEMLGWSEMTVQKLFNDPKFPATDFGKTKVIEAHALIEYFSERHDKRKDLHWK